jgi:DNA-binding XRE family transcriptional regulator
VSSSLGVAVVWCRSVLLDDHTSGNSSAPAMLRPGNADSRAAVLQRVQRPNPLRASGDPITRGWFVQRSVLTITGRSLATSAGSVFDPGVRGPRPPCRSRRRVGDGIQAVNRKSAHAEEARHELPQADAGRADGGSRFPRRVRAGAAEIDQVDSVIRQLDHLREEAGLTKAELARHIGRDPSSIRRLFTAQANPELMLVASIAENLGADVRIVPR